MINSFMFDSYIDSDDSLYPNKQHVRRDSIIVSNVLDCQKLFIGYKTSETSLDRGFLFSTNFTSSNPIIISYIPDGTTSTLAMNLGINIIYDVEIFADHTSTTTTITFSKI